MKKFKSFREDKDLEAERSKKVNFKKFLNTTNEKNSEEDEFEDIGYMSPMHLKKIDEDGETKRLISLDEDDSISLKNEDITCISSLGYDEDVSIVDNNRYNWHITRSYKDEIIFENDDPNLDFLSFKMKFSDFLKKLK